MGILATQRRRGGGGRILLVQWASCLGPPVERLEQGYQLVSVYFSRGTLPQKRVYKRALLGDLDEETTRTL